MRYPDSLRRRFAVAYLLFALGSSLFFAVVVALAVEGIEVHLVDNRLKEVATWASPRFAGGLPVTMPAGLSFHHSGAIPKSLRELPEGVSEIHVDGVGLHVLRGQDKSGEYVVVDHESDYEKVELVIYSLFGASLVGFLLCALFLGSFIGRRFVNPITELATAVREGVPQLPLLERQDELGTLARAFATHTGQLRSYLDRERYFTGDVSHELRTPLTIIMGAAEILAANGAGEPAIAAPAERILQAASEAAECVNVLLLLARAPQTIAHPDSDIAAIARSTTARHQGLVEGKPLELRFAGGEAFSAPVQAELCAAAIGNLVRNACQYTASGSVVVRLGQRSVVVEDSGPGLPAAVRAALLNQPGDAPSGASSGTGLGLTLVRRICDQLGASLALSDRPGGGSIFEIRFPPI